MLISEPSGSAAGADGRGPRPPGRKGPRGKKGRKARSSRKRKHEPLLAQPVAQSSGAVPCKVCGHPVDPKRLHFHMVRFHGAALRPPPP
ncbi:MAG TPA: hypothetical protein PKI20_14260 [Verrucomicrobiota bacterium]|nr:hypothetical protein [Verrucomicrobiota bacterium]